MRPVYSGEQDILLTYIRGRLLTWSSSDQLTFQVSVLPFSLKKSNIYQQNDSRSSWKPSHILNNNLQ